MFSLSILFYIRCFIVHFILQTRTPPCSDVSFFSSWACYFLPTCAEKGNTSSHPKGDSAYSCRNTRFLGNDTRPDSNRRKTHISGRIHSLLSFLNSHPSPNLRKSRAMPTDPLTATSSPKATKRIKAIVSIFVNFKNLGGASGIEPEKTRLSRSLSTDALTGLVETALVSRRERQTFIVKNICQK